MPSTKAATIPETAAAIEALHARGVPQYGLSNMSHEVLDGITSMSPAFGCLRDIVISAETAIMKPDPRIFRVFCERYGIAPESCVFIDDNDVNVVSARRYGMAGIHFTSPAALRAELISYGLPLKP